MSNARLNLTRPDGTTYRSHSGKPPRVHVLDDSERFLVAGTHDLRLAAALVEPMVNLEFLPGQGRQTWGWIFPLQPGSEYAWWFHEARPGRSYKRSFPAVVFR